jgi:DnaK suppressor protein
MLKSEELKEFRSMLRFLRARIRGDVEQLEQEAFSASESGGHGSSNHMAEMGTDAWDLDFSLRIVENDQEILSEIDAAIAKIDEGTFGICEMCLEAGKPASKAGIPKARLRAIPYTRNCVNCERLKEES